MRHSVRSSAVWMRGRLSSPKRSGIEIRGLVHISAVSTCGEQGRTIKITRLARGLPVGGELEYADEETLGSALEGRK